MTADKAEIRAFARAARRSIPAIERPVRAAAAAGRLATLPELARATWVLGYMANDEEIDPAPGLRALKAQGRRIAYPRISGPGTLVLHEIRGDADVEPGPYGISQPTEDAPVVARNDIDAVIVPGVAFGPDGARIGYGGGYYDRLLLQIPDAVRIGLAFDEQIVGDIPLEDHDALVDIVVTPSRVLRVGVDL